LAVEHTVMRRKTSEDHNRPKLQRIGSQHASTRLRRSAVALMMIQPSSHPAIQRAEALRGNRCPQDIAATAGAKFTARTNWVAKETALDRAHDWIRCNGDRTLADDGTDRLDNLGARPAAQRKLN